MWKYRKNKLSRWSHKRHFANISPLSFRAQLFKERITLSSYKSLSSGLIVLEQIHFIRRIATMHWIELSALWTAGICWVNSLWSTIGNTLLSGTNTSIKRTFNTNLSICGVSCFFSSMSSFCGKKRRAANEWRKIRAISGGDEMLWDDFSLG